MKVKVLAAILAATGSLSSGALGINRANTDLTTRFEEINTDLVCFSIRELPKCKEGFEPFQKRMAFVDMFCLGKSDQKAQDWLNQLQKGFSISSQLRLEKSNSKARVSVPTKCVPVGETQITPLAESLFEPMEEFSLMDAHQIAHLEEIRREQTKDILEQIKYTKDVVTGNLPTLAKANVAKIGIVNNVFSSFSTDSVPEITLKAYSLNQVLDLSHEEFERLHSTIRSYVENIGLKSHLEALSVFFALSVENAETVYLSRHTENVVNEQQRKELRENTERVYVYALHSMLRDVFAKKSLNPIEIALKVKTELPAALDKVWLATSLQLNGKQLDDSKLIAKLLNKNVQSKLEGRVPLFSLTKEQLTSIVFSFNKLIASGFVLKQH